MSAPIEGRVLARSGGVYTVDLGDEIVDCPLRGRLKLDDQPVAPGDRVRLERVPQGGFRIDRRLPRAAKLSRLASSGGREQVIVANVDRLAAVFAVDRPPPEPGLLDRLLVLAELNELPALIVLNKVDLESHAGDGDPPDRLGAYPPAGYPILRTSARRGDGIAELREALGDHATVLAGPSGVGKSSLLNLLLPGQTLRVREVSPKAGRGRHTTVASTFYRLPAGGYVADTPGLQYLRLADLSADELAGAFPEFRPAIGGCRFGDCRHLSEPDCAVRRLVETGAASEARYRSYRTLLDEATENAR